MLNNTVYYSIYLQKYLQYIVSDNKYMIRKYFCRPQYAATEINPLVSLVSRDQYFSQ